MSNMHTTDWMLIVEDQDDLWTILHSSLRRTLPHVQTQRAINATRALQSLKSCLAEERPLPRMVLSNLYLPHREDGIQLVAAIKKASSGFAHLPVVVMSSSTDPLDQQTLTESGAFFLTKPAQYKEWEDFLNRIGQQWDASAQPIEKR